MFSSHPLWSLPEGLKINIKINNYYKNIKIIERVDNS